jgi:uncharacterized protein (DUF1778 family)
MKTTTPKRPRGRPVKPSDKRKSETVLLRLDMEEKKAFASAADLAGVPVSAWMRERLRRAARIELAEASRSIPFLGQGR